MSMTNINEPLEPLNILYICTHNRCRSALSEAITNQLGKGLLLAKSAGSQPAGEVHPLTLKYLTQAGYDIAGLTSNSWQDTAYMGNFKPDVVITVCDNAAGESCPLWLGAMPKLHWGLSDPSKDTMDEAKTAANFQQAIAAIEHRVEKLLAVAQLASEQRLKALTELNQ
ncbi:arsenate reductase ArsC [Psychrobacter arenosus]|uniref:arsenate reductase ArsC n=1 Tax=Psychrobacter arenosus TaxID=256326 RepID=UPI001D12704F|nr:arsenate reductase ArsC [Psychrobacter arenosus]